MLVFSGNINVLNMSKSIKKSLEPCQLTFFYVFFINFEHISRNILYINLAFLFPFMCKYLPAWKLIFPTNQKYVQFKVVIKALEEPYLEACKISMVELLKYSSNYNFA